MFNFTTVVFDGTSPTFYTVQPTAPRLQTCTACYCTEYCRLCDTMVSIVML